MKSDPASDIIGLQNQLHEQGLDLIQGINQKQDILSLMNRVDTKSIAAEDVTAFIKARIKDEVLADQMIKGICTYKNYYGDFGRMLTRLNSPLTRLVAANRDEFESGTTMVMIGSKSEQTGYSHEPVGAVMDMPASLEPIYQVNVLLQAGLASLNDAQAFFGHLQSMLDTTFDYNEKNQAGGRALRTPYGRVNYTEYLSNLNQYLAEQKVTDNSPLAAWKIETSFADIFTPDEALAQRERISITFNRAALAILKTPTAGWGNRRHCDTPRY